MLFKQLSANMRNVMTVPWLQCVLPSVGIMLLIKQIIPISEPLNFLPLSGPVAF